MRRLRSQAVPAPIFVTDLVLGTEFSSRRFPIRAPAELPVVQHQVAFWQIVHLPTFHTATIPVDLRVTERDEP